MRDAFTRSRAYSSLRDKAGSCVKSAKKGGSGEEERTKSGGLEPMRTLRWSQEVSRTQATVLC